MLGINKEGDTEEDVEVLGMAGSPYRVESWRL